MDSDKINYGLIFAGLTGAYWGYKEYTNDSSRDSISSLKSSVAQVNTCSKENNSKLVYTSGVLHPSNPSSLQDPMFGISVQGLKLRRKVEMFQWMQIKNSSMTLGWVAHPISSEKFLPNFINPKWKLFDLDLTAKAPFKVNGFSLGSEILNHINSWKEVQGEYTGSEYKHERIENRLVLHKSKKKRLTPKVGNYRVTHDYIPSGVFVSIIGMQKDNRIVPYKGRLMLIKEGIVKPDDMLDEYGAKKSLNIWVVRATCFLGMGLGLRFAFRKKNE